MKRGETWSCDHSLNEKNRATFVKTPLWHSFWSFAKLLSQGYPRWTAPSTAENQALAIPLQVASVSSEGFLPPASMQGLIVSRLSLVTHCGLYFFISIINPPAMCASLCNVSLVVWYNPKWGMGIPWHIQSWSPPGMVLLYVFMIITIVSHICCYENLITVP